MQCELAFTFSWTIDKVARTILYAIHVVVDMLYSLVLCTFFAIYCRYFVVSIEDSAKIVKLFGTIGSSAPKVCACNLETSQVLRKLHAVVVQKVQCKTAWTHLKTFWTLGINFHLNSLANSLHAIEINIAQHKTRNWSILIKELLIYLVSQNMWTSCIDIIPFNAGKGCLDCFLAMIL